MLERAIQEEHRTVAKCEEALKEAIALIRALENELVRARGCPRIFERISAATNRGTSAISEPATPQLPVNLSTMQ